MKSKQIKDILKQFDKNNTYKKIFINGVWGIGKSYYANEYLAEHKKNIIYVSLFGKTSFDSITSELDCELIRCSKNYETRKKSFLDSLNDVSVEANFLGIINVSAPIVKSKNILLEFSKVLNKKELIIIIDDLERKSPKIPIEDIMGMVEELSTLEKIKIVLIGDESKINGNDIEKWENFKEKIIDKEYKINTFSYDAIESLVINKLKGYISKELLDDYISLFIKKHKIKNLRTINKGINLFLEIVNNYISKKHNEKVYLVILKNCMAVAIELTEELYKTDKAEEKEKSKIESPSDKIIDDIITEWQIKNNLDISYRIKQNYFNENTLFGYDTDSSILDYIIKIYNSEITDELIQEFNKVLNTFVEKKQKPNEKNVFYLSERKIKEKVSKIYNHITSEKYQIITLEEFIDDLYNMFRWNKALDLKYNFDDISNHVNNILLSQYYDLSKEEYQNQINKFSFVRENNTELCELLDNYNNLVVDRYSKEKIDNILTQFKHKNYNPDILNFLKWKFKQENSKIARKYFLEICKKNNFLIPNLKSEIDELSWRWTHSIWDIFYECLNDKKANEELNNYVNSIKKNNKLLAYRISLLQESKSLVKNK